MVGGKLGKSISVTNHGNQWCCEMSKLSHFIGNCLTDGAEVVCLTHRPPLTPRRFLALISVRS
jgi:hypothetical protein